MIVTYTETPGAEPQCYDADGLTCGEADAVSRAIEMPWSEITQVLRNQEPAAMRGVVWAWRKRQEPTLRFTAFDPPIKALKAKFSTEEIPDFLKALDRSDFTDSERTRIRAEVIDLAIDPAAAQRVIASMDTAATQPPKEEVEPEPLPMTTEPSESFATTTAG